MKKTHYIRQAKLARLLNGISGRTMIVGLTICTEPQMRLTGNPFRDRVKKWSDFTAVVGAFDYTSAVNRQRQREGLEPDFVALPPAWGNRVVGTCFHEYMGRLYLAAKVQNHRSTFYTIDGAAPSEKDLATLHKFLPTKLEGARQGVDNPVIYRTIALHNIRGLRAYNKTYYLRD